MADNQVKKTLSLAFASLQIKNFRYFWCGQCISLIGTWMQRTAQVWLVYSLTDSPFLVGLIGVCQFTPMLLFTLFAGAIVDHFPSKKIIIVWTQFFFMVQSLIFTLLTYFGVIQYWHVFILSAIFGMLQTFDTPARQSFFYELVGQDHIMNAISLNSTIFNLARLIGPAVAGFVMFKYGMLACFFGNFLSFGAVLVSLYFVHPDHQPREKIAATKNIVGDMQEGLHYIWNNRDLRINVFVMAIVCTFAYNVDVVTPIFAKEVLRGGGQIYTVLLSFSGLGALIGALFMSIRAVHGINKKLYCFSIFLTAGVQILYCFIVNLPIAILGVILISFGNITFLNMANAIFQVQTDAKYRGRVMSIYSFLNQGSTPIGNFYVGSVMQALGGAAGFPSCGLAIAACFGLLTFFEGKKLKNWILS